MRTTAEAVLLIRSFETCSLVAYQDSGGRWTLGWGRARGVKKNDTCTQEQADAWFLEDLAEFEMLVLACIPVHLTDNQFSALVSFVFNVGLGYKGIKDGFKVLMSGEPSTMLTCLVASDFAGAAAEFPRWDKVSGIPSTGVLRRRMAEQALFLKPDNAPCDV